MAQWLDHNDGRSVTLLLDNDTVRHVLRMRAAIDALERAFRELADGRAVNRPRSHTYTDLGDGRQYLFKSMDGSLPSAGVHALRLTSDLVEERDGRRAKLPAAPGRRYVGLVLLFDLETLVPLALIHDGELQRVRVGATSALAADRLASPSARVAAIVGAGWQAATQIAGLREVRELEEVRVFAPTRAKLEPFCVENGATPAPSVRAALDGADVVALATNSRVPVLDGAWLQPGQHVGSVQGGELDSATLRRADVVVVRSRERATHHFAPGRAPREVERANGFAAVEAVELGEVVAGRAGRTSREQITLFTGGGTGASSGLGIQFAAVADVVYRAARERGLGRELPTEWFLQEEKP
jgi:ornithine cyclodeaminase/alanine dehydrogenase-like protein (mu-crystallin family)